MKSIDKIKVSARSESMNKWIARIEEECGFETKGSTPTSRMESIIDQIKSTQEVTAEGELKLNQLIRTAFLIGAESGFNRALDRFHDGKIKTKKVANQSLWTLHSNSRQYQITKELPSFDGANQQATIYLTLADLGFE